MNQSKSDEKNKKRLQKRACSHAISSRPTSSILAFMHAIFRALRYDWRGQPTSGMAGESSIGKNEQWVGAGGGPVHKAPLPIVLSEDPTFCLDASPSSESTYAARPAVFNACNEKRKSQLVNAIATPFFSSLF